MTRKMERIAMKKMIEVHNEKSGSDKFTVGPAPTAVVRPPAESDVSIPAHLSREEREALMIKARQAEQASLKRSWWKFW